MVFIFLFREPLQKDIIKVNLRLQMDVYKRTDFHMWNIGDVKVKLDLSVGGLVFKES